MASALLRAAGARALIVYRSGAQRVATQDATRALIETLRHWGANDARLEALIRAGELEAGLADAGAPAAAAALSWTDAIAVAWLAHTALDTDALMRQVLAAPLPAELCITRPEGYAYYALEPAAYADLAVQRAAGATQVAVIGVRSIGTSLAAAVRAALARHGSLAERITVRPCGHPWNRRLELTPELQGFISPRRHARYFIVDEGPGMSGSTFLAVAECLESAGVPREQIELLTSHAVPLAQLSAHDAARRWQRFRATAVPEPALPPDASDLSGGAWRTRAYASEAEWPACWPALERRKYRTRSGELVKFAGLPPYSTGALARGERLAAAGFCPPVRAHSPGYLAHAWYPGRPCGVHTRAPATSILEYLDFRSRHCAAEAADSAGLEQMLRVNVAEALGVELPSALKLELERPAFNDGRLMPHEWIETSLGELVKVDALDHGDDHLWPGPCDTAWDVAGALVEWHLLGEVENFVECYRARTGDNVGLRLGPYLLAYAAFRWGHAELAGACAPASERQRLGAERARYLAVLGRLLAEQGHARALE